MVIFVKSNIFPGNGSRPSASFSERLKWLDPRELRNRGGHEAHLRPGDDHGDRAYHDQPGPKTAAGFLRIAELEVAPG
jgi:hypothetical protein